MGDWRDTSDRTVNHWARWLFVGFVLAIVLFGLWQIFGVSEARAQENFDTVVDFRPVITVILPLLATLIFIAGMAAFTFAAKHVAILRIPMFNTMFHNALNRALDAALLEADKLAMRHGQVDVKNKVVKQAADYMIEHMADTLKTLKVDSGTLTRQIENALNVKLAKREDAKALRAVEFEYPKML
jgi:citrate lyase gamma subunit